jgi:hypothetical protein
VLQRAKIGDTVLFKAVVTAVNTVSPANEIITVRFVDCVDEGPFDGGIAMTRIHQIVENPLQPGDEVYVNDGTLASTVLCVHGDPVGDGHRQWGVVAYKGDIPRAYPLEQLRRAA